MSPYDVKRAPGLEADNPFWNVFFPLAMCGLTAVLGFVSLYSYLKYSSLPVH